MFHFFMENRNIKEIGKEGKRPTGTNEGRAPIGNLDTRPYGRKNETYLMGFLRAQNGSSSFWNNTPSVGTTSSLAWSRSFCSRIIFRTSRFERT